MIPNVWFIVFQEENGALSDDLAMMVRENQVVSGQLSRSAQQVDEAADEMRTLQNNLGVSQQTLKARELELEDMRHAYEEVAGMLPSVSVYV